MGESDIGQEIMTFRFKPTADDVDVAGLRGEIEWV